MKRILVAWGVVLMVAVVLMWQLTNHPVEPVVVKISSKEELQARVKQEAKAVEENELDFFVSRLTREPNFDQSVADALFHERAEAAVHLPGKYVGRNMLEWMAYHGQFFYLSRHEKWDAKLVSIAFTSNHDAALEAPSELITTHMIEILLHGGYFKDYATDTSFWGLSIMSEWVGWTADLAHKALAQDYRLYPGIPEKLRSYQLSKRAVEKDGLLLGMVPREQRFTNNGELCRIALRQTDDASPFVPEYFKYKFTP